MSRKGISILFLVVSPVIMALLTVSGHWSLYGLFTSPVFFVQHLREQPGQQTTEVVSYKDESRLDNSGRTGPLHVQIEFERNYYKIITRIGSQEVLMQRVQDRIVELYDLPADMTETTIQTARCPASVVIPGGERATLTLEWTERWVEGVIWSTTFDHSSERHQVGTYSVFFGYFEPCSLISQVNTG